MNDICCQCAKGAGGCKWQDSFEPIDGWDAVKQVFTDNNEIIEQYEIRSCPEFKYSGICTKCSNFKTIEKMLNIDTIKNPEMCYVLCRLYRPQHDDYYCTNFSNKYVPLDTYYNYLGEYGK